MNRGFVIIAQNTTDVDYIKCATVLAKNIKRLMPDEKVALITGDKIKNKAFDKVVQFPYGDLDKDGKWKLINDWQVYEASPFEYTIKIEADIYLPKRIDHWWDVLKQRDVVVSTTIRDFKQSISSVRFYRGFIDDNNLPNVYNALTYFRKSGLAEKFYKIVRNIFENWPAYRSLLKCNTNEEVTTDWVYALACHILGAENTTMPQFEGMSMVHMKQFINNMPTENWTDTLIYELVPNCIRINTVPQKYPFHYHVKSFADKLENAYD
jgi:hypothetical protein